MSEVITKDRDTAKHHFPQPLAAAGPAFHHLKAFELAPHQEKLVLNSEGILKLGELLVCGWDQSN